MGAFPFILASASPRRRELLSQLGLDPAVQPADLDEEVRPAEPPERYAQRIARNKGELVAAVQPGALVLAADTCVVLAGHIFGKPRDAEEAVRTLLQLSDRTHEVMTAVWLGGRVAALETLVTTRVRFRAISEAEARWYAATGEPLDKAGAYAIQGRGGAFVQAIEGSYSNVVGLPLAESLAMLAQAGLSLPWGAAQ